MRDFSDLSAHIAAQGKHNYDRLRLAGVRHNLFGLGEDSYDFDDPVAELAAEAPAPAEPMADENETPDSAVADVDEADPGEPESEADESGSVESAAEAKDDDSAGEAEASDANLPVPHARTRRNQPPDPPPAEASETGLRPDPGRQRHAEQSERHLLAG